MVSLNLTLSLAIIKCLLTCIMVLSLKTQYNTKNRSKMTVQNGENTKGVYYLLTFPLLTKAQHKTQDGLKNIKVFTQRREKQQTKTPLSRPHHQNNLRHLKALMHSSTIFPRTQAAGRRQKPADFVCSPPQSLCNIKETSSLFWTWKSCCPYEGWLQFLTLTLQNPWLMAWLNSTGYQN